MIPPCFCSIVTTLRLGGSIGNQGNPQSESPTRARPGESRFSPHPGRSMKHITDDVGIRAIKELSPPAGILREFRTTDAAADTTYDARQAVHRVLHGADDRLVVVVGPCSIHDYAAAMEYARKLRQEGERFADD